jgi:hypothetical protein
MSNIVDVVNFNADASCLSTEAWFGIMGGGSSSQLCQWLRLYVEMGKKVVLGFTGATIADMAAFNPEAIQLVKTHPAVFQLIARPFAHDIALLRSESGFKTNLDLGLRVIKREFDAFSPNFLPPEFMLTNEQVDILARHGIRGTFINPDRFPKELKLRIPQRPYILKGAFDAALNCIPFAGHCTSEYLKSIQLFDCAGWNEAISSANGETVFTWRDGESAFFLPNCIDREACWLAGESGEITRNHLDETKQDFLPNADLEHSQYRSYPVMSFLPWMREFRMLSFVNRLVRLEHSLSTDGMDDSIFSWVMAIGSDIFSAIEKKSPVIQSKRWRGDEVTSAFTIMRTERGFEGEEYLILAEKCLKQGSLSLDLLKSETLHHRRYLARMEYLGKLGGNLHACQ